MSRVWKRFPLLCNHSIKPLDDLVIAHVRLSTTAIQMGLPAKNGGSMGGCILFAPLVSRRQGRTASIRFMPILSRSQAADLFKSFSCGGNKALIYAGS